MVTEAEFTFGCEFLVSGGGLAEVAGSVIAQPTEIIVVFYQVFATVWAFRWLRPPLKLLNIVCLIRTLSLKRIPRQLYLPLHSHLRRRHRGRPHIIRIIGRLALKRRILPIPLLPHNLRPQILILPIEPLIAVIVAGLALEAAFR